MHDIGAARVIVGRVTVTLEDALKVAKETPGPFPLPAHAEVEHHHSTRPAIFPQTGSVVITEIGEVSVRKRRSRKEIKRLVREFETRGLRRSEFCHKHNWALGTLQLRRRRMEVDGQSEDKRLVKVKMAGIRRNGSRPNAS